MEKVSFFDKHVKKFVIFAVICGATSGIFGALITAPSMMIGFFRLTVAVPVFGIPILLKGRDTLKAMSKRDWMYSALAGIFLFGHFFTWYNAVKLTTVSSAAVLAALHPLVVIFCTVFIFKRKVTLKQIMAILIAIAGAAIIAFTDASMGTQLAPNPVLGNIFAFCSGICMGIYFQFGNEARAKVPGPTYVFVCFTCCWICFLLGIILTGTPVLGYPAMDYVYMLCVTVICQLGTHAIFNLCLGRVDSLFVSTWETGDALFSTILALICLAQLPSLGGWIGCVVTTAGLLMFNYFTDKLEKEKHGLQG
ncbi:MAG: DMT family transporter [Clostridia bacterium]|nr:DMT family transporter [Clostridia bacterium]